MGALKNLLGGINKSLLIAVAAVVVVAGGCWWYYSGELEAKDRRISEINNRMTQQTRMTNQLRDELDEKEAELERLQSGGATGGTDMSDRVAQLESENADLMRQWEQARMTEQEQRDRADNLAGQMENLRRQVANAGSQDEELLERLAEARNQTEQVREEMQAELDDANDEIARLRTEVEAARAKAQKPAERSPAAPAAAPIVSTPIAQTADFEPEQKVSRLQKVTMVGLKGPRLLVNPKCIPGTPWGPASPFKTPCVKEPEEIYYCNECGDLVPLPQEEPAVVEPQKRVVRHISETAPIPRCSVCK